MWTPISLNRFVKLYLKKNPAENEKAIRDRIDAAIDYYNSGMKCECGKDIWIVGSVSAPFACFTCISGEPHPRGDYEIDKVMDKRDKSGRRHIDEMDPQHIAGIFNDDGYEVRKETIKMQPLCLDCRKNLIDDWDENLLCDMNRADQGDEKEFKCDAYERL